MNEGSVFLSGAPRRWAIAFCVVAVVGRYGLDQLGYGSLWQRFFELMSAVLAGAVVVRFSPDDPPRRPWIAVFLWIALVSLARLANWLDWSVAEIQAQNLLFIVANIMFAGSILGFARVLGSSEFLSERTGSARVRAMLTVSTIAAGPLVFTGYNLFELISRGPPTTPDGWVSAITSGVSTVSDGLMFAGGLYLVWLLRPLIGGILALPYLLMSYAGGVFLIVDLLLISRGAVAQTDVTDIAVHLLGILAYSLFGAAALVQLKLLRLGRT